MEINNCHCGNNISYNFCCKKIHLDIMNAETAEALMRSRYTAYVLANEDYLMKSHHSSTRPIKEKNAIIKWAKSVDWIKLEVLECKKGLQNDIEGMVEFKAFFYENSKIQMIHENSRFTRENGHWVYVDPV